MARSRQASLHICDEPVRCLSREKSLGERGGTFEDRCGSISAAELRGRRRQMFLSERTPMPGRAGTLQRLRSSSRARRRPVIFHASEPHHQARHGFIGEGWDRARQSSETIAPGRPTLNLRALSLPLAKWATFGFAINCTELTAAYTTMAEPFIQRSPTLSPRSFGPPAQLRPR
jgi:hypothetical protein